MDLPLLKEVRKSSNDKLKQFMLGGVHHWFLSYLKYLQIFFSLKFTSAMSLLLMTEISPSLTASISMFSGRNQGFMSTLDSSLTGSTETSLNLLDSFCFPQDGELAIRRYSHPGWSQPHQGTLGSKRFHLQSQDFQGDVKHFDLLILHYLNICIYYLAF